jgi:hypothetical protein
MVIEYTETVTSIGGVNGNVLTIGTPSSDMSINSYKDLHFVYEDSGDPENLKVYEILSNTATTITIRLPLNSNEGIPDLSGVIITIKQTYATLKQLRARANRITDLEIVVDNVDADQYFIEVNGDINEELEIPDGSDITNDTNIHKTWKKSLGGIQLDRTMSLIIATRAVKERDVNNVTTVYYNKPAEFTAKHLRKLEKIKAQLKKESRGSKSASVFSQDLGNKIY